MAEIRRVLRPGGRYLFPNHAWHEVCLFLFIFWFVCLFSLEAANKTLLTRGWARSGLGRFLEHVLSESNPVFAAAQRLATPEHVQTDGCHFDRRTFQTIQDAGVIARLSLPGLQVYPSPSWPGAPLSLLLNGMLSCSQGVQVWPRFRQCGRRILRA